MPAKTPVHIPEADLAAVGKVLHDGIPGRPVFVFGSRVTGLARPDSDLDLAIGGDHPLTLRERSSLSDAFENMRLHFKVDVIDLHDARGLFRQRIEAEWIPWEQVEASQAEVVA